MKAPSVPTVLALALALTFLAAANEAAAIYGGYEDDSGIHDNVAKIVVRDDSTGELYPVCTAVLVGPNALLSAGHCIGGPANWWGADVGNGWSLHATFDATLPLFEMSVPETVLHPIAAEVGHPSVATNSHSNAQGGGPITDLAVYVLATSVTGPTPAVLPACGYLSSMSHAALGSADLEVVGYGIRSYSEGILNPAQRRYAFPGFQSLVPGFLRIQENTARGYGGTCDGDSGGPTYITDGGTQILVGITSTGDGNCTATSAQTRLDTRDAQQFLESVNDAYGTLIPTDC